MNFAYPTGLTLLLVLTRLSLLAVEVPPPLSESEATTIVEAQIQAENVREAERKRRILEVDAAIETSVGLGGHQAKVRRVEPRFLAVAQSKLRDQPAPNAMAPLGAFTEDYKQVHISLLATVYDDTYTQVIWRDEEGHRFTAWTNVNFKYFGAIHSFEVDSVHYSYFGMTSEIDTGTRFTHPVTGEAIQPYRLPEWMPSAGDFSDEPSYLVLVEDDVEAPEGLYREMDALLTHYTEEKTSLIAAYERAEALRKARAAYLEDNPQPEKDIVINYWPIRSRSER